MRRLAVLMACFVMSLAAAVPAQADAGDQQYLDVLKANGLACGEGPVPCPHGDATIISIGHQICTQLKSNSKRSITSLIVKNMAGVQLQQAAVLVTAAESSYCPER